MCKCFIFFKCSILALTFMMIIIIIALKASILVSHFEMMYIMYFYEN